MATAAPNQSLPLFYNGAEPLNVGQHGKMKVRTVLRMPQVGATHAIPLTVDEFPLVQRHYPIVFSIGDNPIPIALMGLNEGVNVFLDKDGRPLEAAGQRTAAFMDELTKSDLLMDGEVAIQPEGFQQPFVYRGFRIVDEEKLRSARGDELRKMNQNGMLPLIYAHLFSLSQMRDVFGRQMQQGKAPAQVPQPAPADA